MAPIGRRIGIVALGAVVVLRLGRAAVLFVNVSGRSMEPTLEPGDRVLALRRWIARPLRVGDIVVLQADGRNLIKRLAAMGGMPVPGEAGRTVPTGSLWLLGDGQESLDSRHFGAVGDDEVIGLVVRRLWSDPRQG